MARDYARIMTAIWRDRDFRALDEAAQRWYLMLVTQPEITAAGVLITRVEYWSSLAVDSQAEEARRVLTRLDEKLFVVTDWDTDELLVRSFIRWDGGFNNPKRKPVIRKAAQEVISDRLTRSLEIEFAACGLASLRPGRPSVALPDGLPDGLSGRASDQQIEGFNRQSDGYPTVTLTGIDPFLFHDPRFPPSSQVDRLSGRASDVLSPSEGVAVDQLSGEDTATHNPQPTTHEPPQAEASSSDAAASTEAPASEPATRDPVIEDLCALLAAKIVENGFRPTPTVTDTWRKDMRRLIEIDERPPEKVRRMILWLANDAFWAPNVKSPGKLRIQWDKLAAKANAEHTNGQGTGTATRKMAAIQRLKRGAIQ